ncbi:hypothetical protein GGR52DRAFT_522301 [Hypoxylon sp. FL1284]|nr:hypothetical protein GGR52DRAFT_522301 [Hypoxylon sp. FL1284]
MDASVGTNLVEPPILPSVDPRRTFLGHELVIFHKLELISSEMPRQRVPITFTYQKAGTYPPIYVAGTFSDPPWQPQEMDVSIDQDGGHLFTKTVMVEDGSEIQYKFRIGSGNWWALDDNADTGKHSIILPLLEWHGANGGLCQVKDNWGNVNNELRASINESQETDTKTTPQTIEPDSPSPTSGVQSHDVASVAAEVADTASAIDTRTPEPEVSDVEAGRTGIRRMSNTPIHEVAQTAMEVSDVAATLDCDFSDLEDDFETSDNLDDENCTCPMFSYESMGPPSETDEASDLSTGDTVAQDSNAVSDTEDVDFDNPQLERLPSCDRHSIIAAVRRISTSIEADHTVIDGMPLSSVIPILQQQGADSSHVESRGSSESISTPPRDGSSHQPTIGTDLSDSVFSRPSEASISSLGSIAEDDELPTGNQSRGLGDTETTTPFVQHPGPSWGSALERAVGSDSDDEGIAMRVKSRRGLEEPASNPPSSTTSPVTANGNSIVETAEPNPKVSGSEEASTILNSEDEQVVERASKDSSDSTTHQMPGTYASSNIDSPSKGEEQATPTNPDNQADPILKTQVTDKTVAPSSTHSFHDPNKYPGWLKSFFQASVVKWLGGFAAWIYNRRPRTLVAAGTAAMVVGVGVLWQSPIRL